MIVDTHLHLIDKAALRYPWLETVPPLNRDFAYAEYATEARRLGIGAVLHMEVDVAEEDMERETERVGALADQDGSMIRGAIAACRPEAEGFTAFLERAGANPLVKGFRRVLHVMPDGLSESARFRENVARLAGARLPFDICALPRQMPQVLALVDGAPDVQFVLDHCGVPDIKGGDLASWREGVAAVAKRANVAAKISGIVAYADPDGWAVETLRPYVEHVISCFGWDRVVWGSDWPVCRLGGGLSTWVGATHALLEGCSAAEKEKLFSGNARRIWNLG